jgi:hypothetical protein
VWMPLPAALGIHQTDPCCCWRCQVLVVVVVLKRQPLSTGTALGTFCSTH